MADERKKRLEEIRNRKKQLQKMMEQNSQSEATSPAIPQQPPADSASRIETSASDSTSSSRAISTNPSFRAQKRNSVKNEIIYNRKEIQ